MKSRPFPLLLERLDAARRTGHHRCHGHPDGDRPDDPRRRRRLRAWRSRRTGPLLHAEVERFFADPPPALAFERSQTIDGDHGRIEIRRHAVCHDVSWLFSDRRFPGEFSFPGLAAIGMVESETERGGKIEQRPALLSLLHRGSMPRPSPGPCVATGASRTVCTGCSTWCSTTIWPGCDPATGRPTWRLSSIPRST